MCVCVGGGGGVLSVVKRAECSPTAIELLLLQAEMAEERGAVQ